LAAAARNRERLDATTCRTVRAALPDGLAAARLGEEAFDLIFADPPYDFEEWVVLLEGLEPKLAPDGEAAIEHAARAALPERVRSLDRFDSRRYGDTAVSFYRRRSRASG
jgi:16S rRNA G966 N2-methylase RsmD